ncbi:leucine-rich repeat domain-containing protein, partial [Paenibacillus chibensis]|uniref:leucine-rich repeat domain-containing protein n=2 Tax=Paenibacillus chibensis TaxID=59846 RepID=UPI003D2813E0
MLLKRTQIFLLLLVSVVIGSMSVPVSYVHAADYVVDVPDLNFHEALARNAGFVSAGKPLTDPIYKSDFDKVVANTGGKINYSNKGITDLTGIEGFNDTNVQWLAFDDNEISDLSPMANLTNVANLKILSFNNNIITDAAPISHLTTVQELSLSYNNISDLTPLSGLSNLSKLYLTQNKIEDISPISALLNLKWLYLGNGTTKTNQITDVSPLSGLINLEMLDLTSNDITDFSPLASLVNLTSLQINSNRTRDLNFLAGMTNLTTLGIRSLGLEDGDIAVLSSLLALKTLDMGTLSDVNKISDLNPIKNLSLQDLSVDGERITDFTPLANMTSLKNLNASGNYADIWNEPNKSALSGLPLMASSVLTPQEFLRYESGFMNGDSIDVVTVEVGKTVTVYPIRYPTDDGTTKSFWNTDLIYDTNDIAATAADSSIASTSIANDGVAVLKITGNSPGTTVVSGTIFGQNTVFTTRDLTVNVIPATKTLTSLTVTPATATIQVGETQQYRAKANYSDGSSTDITNVAAWALGDPTKASIDASGLATGTAAGTTDVTATWSGMTGTASLTVTAAPVTPPPVTLQSITVTPATATIQVGETQQYRAKANYSDGSSTDITNVAAWTLGDPTKASIDASGLATGTAAGTTDVTATWSGMTGTASLTVTAAPVTPTPIPEPTPTPIPEP